MYAEEESVIEAKPSSDIAFTPNVKAIQARRGSREAYAKMEARGGFQTKITPDLIAFLTEIDTAYLATANAAGRPSILFDVKAWDVNCQRHIPQKLDAGEVAEVLAKLRSRIETLEAENDKLRAATHRSSGHC